MSQFCQECGSALIEGDVVCMNCGTKLHKATQSAANKATSNFESSQPIEPQVPKQPLSKKQKALYGTIGSIVILLISFIMWGNNFYSAASVQERLLKAVKENDTKSIKKLVVHNNGTVIVNAEAKALALLEKEEGIQIIQDYMNIIPDGSILGIVKKNKVTFENKYAEFEGMRDGLTFTFNGEIITTDAEKEDRVRFGPMLPGKYAVEVELDNQYGKAKDKFSIYIDPRGNDSFDLANETKTVETKFYVPSLTSKLMKNTAILLNKERIPVDEEGYTKKIGPLLIGNNQKVQVVSTFPWGKVTSNSQLIENDEENELEISYLSDDLAENLVADLATFEEQRFQAYAKKDISLIKNLSPQYRKTLEEYVDDEYLFAGKFNHLGIDKRAVYISTDEDGQALLTVTGQVDQEKTWYKMGYDQELEQITPIMQYKVKYNKSKWIIVHSEEGYAGDFEVTNEVDGSKKLYSAKDALTSTARNKVKNNVVDEMKPELENFLNSYLNAGIEAINERDISYSENYYDESGPTLKKDIAYIDYLEKKKITEEIISMTLDDVEYVNDKEVVVSTTEYFTIYTDGEPRDRKYKSNRRLTKVDGNWKVHELIKTTEID
ncbi:hypothetical protein JFL43_22025 [Viridibacillus sp. YIM B01967]|uniref:Zinc-ribbon domain-containing protein n=1 Tax=Viridibacillus soli TaxID=2798301 RepID=A0ABS1HDB6_9BACL|nr:hypothetical protein [Viridibacillus soli]MBK3497435.1 hypothetical protein [Viridibacillus soli]